MRSSNGSRFHLSRALIYTRSSVSSRWNSSLLDNGSRSTLLNTLSTGISERPRSERISSTSRILSSRAGSPTSMQCNSKSESLNSSRVASKARFNSGGKSWMKPTVSVRMISFSSGKRSRRVVGSRVANSRFSWITSELVSEFSKVDFPALV